MEIIRKASELINCCGEVALASVNENGYPRICVLSKIKSVGIKKVFVATGMTGTKTKHFQANPKASICVWKNGDSITLIGTVKVTQERAILEEMWLDWFIEHFSGGVDDPNYMEAGKYSPSLEIAFRIANVFGVPIGDVFQCKAEGESNEGTGK